MSFSNYNRKVCIQLFTQKTLSGWKAKFILEDNEKSFDNITSKMISFAYTAEETKKFSPGKTFAKLILIDNTGNQVQVTPVEVEVVNKNNEPNISGEIAFTVDSIITSQ